MPGVGGGVDGGVHAAVQVDHGHIGGVALAVLVVHIAVFVVQQPGGVVGLYPAAGGLEVLAVAALVAQGPHHHGGGVLVPHHVALRAVHNGLHKLGVVGGVGVVVAVVAGAHFGGHAVALHVRLANDVEAVLAAQLDKPGGVGVVAGANGVDVVALHQAQVF